MTTSANAVLSDPAVNATAAEGTSLTTVAKATPPTVPKTPQSARYDYGRGAKDESIRMFSGDQLPVKRAIAQNFGVFNHLYTAVPSASYPNHQFTQSATSCGVMDNVVNWTQCGGNQTQFPQRTIYDALADNGNSFAMYYNDTPASPSTKNMWMADPTIRP